MNHLTRFQRFLERKSHTYAQNYELFAKKSFDAIAYPRPTCFRHLPVFGGSRFILISLLNYVTTGSTRARLFTNRVETSTEFIKVKMEISTDAKYVYLRNFTHFHYLQNFSSIKLRFFSEYQSVYSVKLLYGRRRVNMQAAPPQKNSIVYCSK